MSVKDLIGRYSKKPPMEYVSCSCLNYYTWEKWIRKNATSHEKSIYAQTDRKAVCVSLIEFLDYIYENDIMKNYRIANECDENTICMYDMLMEELCCSDRIISPLLLDEMLRCYSDEHNWVKKNDED